MCVIGVFGKDVFYTFLVLAAIHNRIVIVRCFYILCICCWQGVGRVIGSVDTCFGVLLSAGFFALEHCDSNANAISRVFISKEILYELLLLSSEVYTYIYIKASEHIVGWEFRLVIIICMYNTIGSIVPTHIVPYNTKASHTVDIEVLKREIL